MFVIQIFAYELNLNSFFKCQDYNCEILIKHYIMRLFFWISLLVLLPKKCARSYNILMVTRTGGRSIHLLFTAIGESLAQAKHNVTILSSFSKSAEHPNITMVEDFHIPDDRTEDSYFTDSLWQKVKKVNDWSFRTVNAYWIEPNSTAMELWHRRDNFDAIIIPWFSLIANYPLFLDYKGSVIMVTTPGFESTALSYSGHWSPPSVTPNVYAPYSRQMNFYERCINIIMSYFVWVFEEFYCNRHVRSMIESKFPSNERYTTQSRIHDRIDLTLVNSHFAIDGPMPLLPNQVEIGLIGIRDPKPLPKELDDFIATSAQAGIIYFSLGTYLNSNMPSRALAAILEAFRRLPQLVLWKLDDNNKLDLPPNVLKKRWLPQQDILGHPKTKLFISHCGVQSTHEAMYHGVPVLALPVFLDQFRNAAMVTQKGFALSLNWNDIDADKIVDAITSLINNSTYSERAKEVSSLLHDLEESPGEKAVWWTEYVIRHNRAPHLRYQGKGLHTLQYICADVMLFFLICAIAAGCFIKLIIKITIKNVKIKVE